VTIELYNSTFNGHLHYFWELHVLLFSRVVGSSSFYFANLNILLKFLCVMSRALADFVWSRGRRKLLILLECFEFGFMSLFQIGKL
jgi:hypothetical protein